jgi:hypothetical protein
VAVDIETAAVIPAVPPEGRRAITDLAIAVFVNAISRVRVTVTGTVEGVIVSLVCDSPADPDLPSSPAWLAVDALLARAIEDGLIRPGEVATYTTLASRPRPALS